jgi:HprK-related kinase A
MTQIALAPVEVLRDTPSAKAASRPVQVPCGVRHYRIGPVGVSLQSDVGHVAEAFHRQYTTYEVDRPALGSFRMDVVLKRSPRTLRRYHHIHGNGEELFVVRKPLSVLPHLEWAINLMIARYLPGFLELHASAMSRDGKAAIFPGAPGRGKTTLAAGLLARGWSYLSDEFALIDVTTGLLHAYPKALCIKKGSFAIVESLGLAVNDRVAHVKGKKGPVRFLNPLAVRPDAVSAPCRAALIVLPEYVPGAPARIEPLSAARAVFELAQVSFNFGRFRRRGFDLLADLASEARCYRLQSGDLEQTCRIVEQFMEGEYE